ncbi:MAG: bifunctional (p)ppGpp synthetase/guanosine-3',5'-bis(diphosphate) 3'-pyrophosphohydrolase [Rhodoferax sp.]
MSSSPVAPHTPSGLQSAPGAGATADGGTATKPASEVCSFNQLAERLNYLSEADLARVLEAYRFADQAHLGQYRNSGEPYITHPIAVAALCAQWRLDSQALAAALLHDALEDCNVTKADLIERFGAPVADLVDGLTKLEKLQFSSREENQAESFRKMLLAMARDVRVILIKLADRSHNMRTLGYSPREKWARIATETLEVYAPIAHRLGLNQTYRELQDLSFRYLRPWRYQVLSKAVQKARGRRRDLIQKVQSDLETAFTQHGMAVQIAGREKTLYSIYRKMDDKNLSFAQVSDIYGFRIIVPTVIDCYTGLGLLHQLYKPVPGRFKDHIAIAKINGYQSLHTTLVGPSGINVEFQLRTQAMHVVAESGVAAHWLYKDPARGQVSMHERMGTRWLQSLLDIQDENRDATEFWDTVKLDLFPDSVYVFTPKSQIMAMPRGATVIDFAYAIHSSVGGHAHSAKVNNEVVPLRTELKNGDVVEIFTAPETTPNPAWLGFVRTARARSKIRQHLKTLAQVESESLGEKMLAQALRSEGIERLPDASQQALWDKLLHFTGNHSRAELLTDIGLGKRIANIVATRLVKLLMEAGERPNALLLSQERLASADPSARGSIAIDGSQSTSVRLATCCRPIPGDAIVGYLGRGEGLAVHAADCQVAQKLQHRDSERFIHVEWADEPVRAFDTGLVVTVDNSKGVLAKVAGAISAAEADITRVDMAAESPQGAIDLRFVVSVRDVQHLEAVLRSLRRTASVLRVQRTKNAAPITP